MGSRILPSIPYLPPIISPLLYPSDVILPFPSYLPPIISPLLYPSDVILPFPSPQWDAISEGLPSEMGGIFAEAPVSERISGFAHICGSRDITPTALKRR
jgi:hypothetical protein